MKAIGVKKSMDMQICGCQTTCMQLSCIHFMDCFCLDECLRTWMHIWCFFCGAPCSSGGSGESEGPLVSSWQPSGRPATQWAGVPVLPAPGAQQRNAQIHGQGDHAWLRCGPTPALLCSPHVVVGSFNCSWAQCDMSPIGGGWWCC